MSTNAQVLNNHTRSLRMDDRFHEAQTIAWNAGVGAPPAARRHPWSIQDALRLSSAHTSKQQYAAPRLCTLLHSARLQQAVTVASCGSVVGKLLAHRLIDRCGR